MGTVRLGVAGDRRGAVAGADEVVAVGRGRSSRPGVAGAISASSCCACRARHRCLRAGQPADGAARLDVGRVVQRALGLRLFEQVLAEVAASPSPAWRRLKSISCASERIGAPLRGQVVLQAGLELVQQDVEFARRPTGRQWGSAHRRRSRRRAAWSRSHAPSRRRRPGRQPIAWRSTPMRAPRRPSAFRCSGVVEHRAADAVGGRPGRPRRAPTIAASSTAASATLRVIGPAVSWLLEIGMMPLRLTRPTVGFMPTRPVTDDGQMMLPSVSVPMPPAARLAAIALPVPELEPQGLRSSTYGLRVRPPRALQPELERVRAEIGPFAQVGLAQDHRAGLAQARDHEGVVLRAMCRPAPASRRSSPSAWRRCCP